MILLAMIATLTGTAIFLTFLLEFALATRRDPLSADTRNRAMRRARRATGMYVRRSGTIELPTPAGAGDLPEPVDTGGAPVA
ncbi:MAG: hypothetical protein QOE54_3241 [Streptosporangiaceae bacterium]|jgi:hypothetical protein|nr:hypothetical protein [Streptosporangiaceae bacterium]MDX6430875.1 hypothetical protein [Streptosporangiaceae bacterium]